MRMRLLPHDTSLGWTPWAWLVYIVPFTMTPLMSERYANTAGWALYAVATLFFVALYLRSYWVRGRELVLVAALTLAMGVAFWPVSYGAGALFIYAAGMIGTLDDDRYAVRGVALIALISVAESLLLRRELFALLWPVVFVVIIGAINIHYTQVGKSNARLRLAHDEIEHLAKAAERERIARDLHDLLGHTLSLVILKSELAAKLAGRDPARAASEIQDVERIAREALTQVRSAVTGYRSGGLASEAEHARRALATAGITFEASLPESPLPPAHEAVLSLSLREAVTNIVRHSGARHCRASLEVKDGECVLTVTDDGRGGSAPFGSGLSGMRERVETLGGSMERDGTRGTRITVRIPAAAHSAEQTA